MAVVDLGEEFVVKNDLTGSQTYRVGLYDSSRDSPAEGSDANGLGSEPKAATYARHSLGSYEAADVGGDWAFRSAEQVSFDLSGVDPLDSRGSADVSGDVGEPRGTAWNDDGTRLFVAGDSGDVAEYQLSTPYEISNPTLNTKFSAGGFYLEGVTFSSDGTTMLVTNTNGFEKFSLGSAYDISNPTSQQTYDPGNYLYSLWMIDDSTLTTVEGNHGVVKYSMSTPLDLSTLTREQETWLTGSNIDVYPFGALFQDSGSTMWVPWKDNPSGKLEKYSLSTAYDITSWTLERTISTPHLNKGTALGDGQPNIALGTASDGVIYSYRLPHTLDSWFITAEFQAADTGDGSVQEHLIAYGDLGDQLKVGSVDTLDISSGTVGFTVT